MHACMHALTHAPYAVHGHGSHETCADHLPSLQVHVCCALIPTVLSGGMVQGVHRGAAPTFGLGLVLCNCAFPPLHGTDRGRLARPQVCEHSCVAMSTALLGMHAVGMLWVPA